MTSSKTRIQNYLRQNKISELFEEMMGKLIKDLPASPIYYLINVLQDKDKKVKHIVRDDDAKIKEKKLEVSSNAMLWATAPVSTKKSISPRETSANQQSPVDGRKYDKPWLSKSKKSPTKSGSKLNQTAPAGDVLKNTKPGWNQKTKISEDRQTDDMVDGDDGLDLGLVYAKPKIVGESKVKIRSEAEEMEAELSLSGKHTDDNKHDDTDKKKKSSKISAKEAKRKRLEELRKLADEAQPKSEKTTQRTSTKNNSDEEDEALEVLEDADELINEGVKNPPKTGFITGRSGQKSKEEIELVLNMSKFFDELGGMEGINQARQINGSETQNKFAEEDDDFESASQVTGPRRPVWETPETEVESVASQLRSARRSDIGVESFVTRPGSAKKEDEPKEKPKRKQSTESRPRTAPPSRPRSNAGSNVSNNNNGRETYKVPDPKSTKSPRSRPTTPKSSLVGRTSRAMSQISNHSEPASPKKPNGGTKDPEKSKKKKSEI